MERGTFAFDGQKKVLFNPIVPKEVGLTDKRGSKSFPEFYIDAYGDEFLRLFAENRVVVVNACADTGKLLYLPYLLGRRAVVVSETPEELIEFHREYTSLDLELVTFTTPELFEERLLKGPVDAVVFLDSDSYISAALLANYGTEAVIFTSSPERLERLFGPLPIMKVDDGDLCPVREQEPLAKTALRLSAAGFDPVKLMGDEESTTLEELSLVDEFGALTEEGHLAAKLPLSLNGSLMIALAMKENKQLLRSTIALACFVELMSKGGELFLTPEGDDIDRAVKRREQIDRYHRRFIGPTDVHTIISVFWAMMSEIDIARQYDLKSRYPFVDYIQDWCRVNAMNEQLIVKILTLQRKVEFLVESSTETQLELSQVLVRTGQNPAMRNFDRARVLPEGGYDFLGNAALPFFLTAYEKNTITLGADGYRSLETGIDYKAERLLGVEDSSPTLVAASLSGGRARILASPFA